MQVACHLHIILLEQCSGFLFVFNINGDLWGSHLIMKPIQAIKKIITPTKKNIVLK